MYCFIGNGKQYIMEDVKKFLDNLEVYFMP